MPSIYVAISFHTSFENCEQKYQSLRVLEASARIIFPGVPGNRNLYVTIYLYKIALTDELQYFKYKWPIPDIAQIQQLWQRSILIDLKPIRLVESHQILLYKDNYFVIEVTPVNVSNARDIISTFLRICFTLISLLF